MRNMGRLSAKIPFMGFYSLLGMLALLNLAAIMQPVQASNEVQPSLIMENYNMIRDKATRRRLDKYLSNFFTMFRTYFEDNLDHCPECYKTFPRTGNDYKSINIVDDDVYKVLQLARLHQPANITKKAYEFLVQLERSILSILPDDNEDLKRETMRLVALGFYKSKHDIKAADQIYRKMRIFDRKSEFRQSLVSWVVTGMSEEYGSVREDLLRHGIEIMHIFMRRREFPHDKNCHQFLEHVGFLLEQSTLWVWQARGLIFSGRQSPEQRQQVMLQGLAGTLLELAWYLNDDYEIPILIEQSCNNGGQDISLEDSGNRRKKRDAQFAASHLYSWADRN